MTPATSVRPDVPTVSEVEEERAWPPIPRLPCVSTVLASYGYDAGRQTLALEFASTAKVYHYAPVTPEEYAQFEQAPSRGAYFGRSLRGQRRAILVSGPCASCGATGVIGQTCHDCGCGRHVDEAQAPRDRIQAFMRPTRVLLNADGDAVAPGRTRVEPTVIFVRRDGWSLGAPAHLEQVVRALYADQWVQVWRRDRVRGQWELSAL